MIACLDVDYRETVAIAAAVVFQDWADAKPAEEKVVSVADVQPYKSGEFYRRELPCLLAVLRTLPPVNTVVIDGYVWLNEESKPGLGAHLYRALDERVVVIGVAKTSFEGAKVCEVRRGTSQRPLFITAAGMEVDAAAEHIRSMHGPYRIPTLLARVDFLSRSDPGN